MHAVGLSLGLMPVQMQLLKPNPGNGRFEVVESSYQPFSMDLGKRGL